MRTFLLFVLFSSPFIARTQSTLYHPFPEDTATWVSDIFYNTCFGYCGSLYYEMKGDTLIGNQTYNKIYRREGDFYYITTPPNSLAGGNFSICTYIGGIRQDISAKRVYFIDSTMTSDTLLYDFDLSVGDTISDWYNKAGMQWPLEVATFDSISINLYFHKRLNYVGFVNGMIRCLI